MASLTELLPDLEQGLTLLAASQINEKLTLVSQTDGSVLVRRDAYPYWLASKQDQWPDPEFCTLEGLKAISQKRLPSNPDDHVALQWGWSLSWGIGSENRHD